MNINYPLISIIIPVYNHTEYINTCIESIWNQDYPNIEIIAIDDGSTDDSFNKLILLKKKSPIEMHIYSHNNMGARKTANIALSLSKGEYIRLIASDDFYLPNTFSYLIKNLLSKKDTPILYTNGTYFQNNIIGSKVHHNKIVEILQSTPDNVFNYIRKVVPRPILLQSCILQKGLLLAINGFDEEVNIDDWALNLKIFKYLIDNNKKHLFIDIDTFHYRIHNDNYHNNSDSMVKGVIQIANKYLPNEYKYTLLFRELFYYGASNIKHGEIRGVLKFISGLKYLCFGFYYKILQIFKK